MNAVLQEAQPESILQFARKRITLRNMRPELHMGSIELLGATEGVLSLVRRYSDSSIVFLFNLGGTLKNVQDIDFAEVVIGEHCKRNGSVQERTRGSLTGFRSTQSS
ncbi:hypothetical protein [Noviherbaspirillum massiliense]|uniref:hypothetical protein n=1 Tax=Noviherbaspirillum massiliense TaxID=1465823 RepID=UPI0002E262BE|nr:hypothetical protein [Noviherbaspirillum massiliense]